MAQASRLKNHSLEQGIFSTRLLIASLLMLIGACVLLARLYHLQVTDYKVHTTLSEKNRINLQPLPPNRGLIYDRNGVLLAENKPSHTVSLIRERVDDLGRSLDHIKSRINLSETELERFQAQFNRRRASFLPVPLKLNLSEKEIAILAVDQHKIPGMEISANLTRFYPKGSSLAHVIGYVARINAKDEQRIDATAYAGTNFIGKTGLEAQYETALHGHVGFQKVEVNAQGRVLNVLHREDPKPGDDLHLYLDLATQEAAIGALKDYNGAVVALEPDTGGIIAFVSQPTFDPNLFVRRIDQFSYQTLNTNPNRPLFNRALKGQYPPGSTIKTIVGLAGLETQSTTWERKIQDPGFFQLDNDPHKYRDWKRQGHGTVDLRKAIVESCDTYFYILSKDMGIDTMHKQLSHFQLGRLTHIDLPGEKAGLLPSRSWKRNRYNQPWYPGETLISGIGQGFMLSTPLQLAVSTAILANRGKIIQPRLVKPHGQSRSSDEIAEKATRIKLSNPTHWDYIESAMVDVVHTSKGTARKIGKNAAYKIAGKTGTAQVIQIKQGEEYDETKIAKKHRDHALFVAFAPAEAPQIAIAVVVENGGNGSSTAAPMARKILDAYLLPRIAQQRNQ